MSERVRVFVSSQYHALRTEREFAELVLREMALEPLLFPEHSVAGESQFEFLRRLETDCHILVYIISEPSENVNEELARGQELGIPVVSLIKLSRDPSTDAFVPTSHALEERSRSVSFSGSFYDLKGLQSQLRTGVAAAIARRFSATTQPKSLGNDAYYEFRSMVDQAQLRLAVVQQTSTLLLGPRVDRWAEEGQVFSAMRRKIQDVVRPQRTDEIGPQLEVIHVFDREATLLELSNNSSAYPQAQEAIEWVRELLGAITESPAISILPARHPMSPMILFDAALACAVSTGKLLWFEQRDSGRTANVVWDQLRNAVASGDDLVAFVEEALSTFEVADSRRRIEAVTPSGERIGIVSHEEAHTTPGVLHRAFSAFVVSDKGRILLQKRSAGKRRFPEKWSNSCCSHPLSSETVLHEAAKRAKYELGIDLTFTEAGVILYRKEDKDTLGVEVEYDHVLVSSAVIAEDASIPFSRTEIAEIKWRTVDETLQAFSDDSSEFAPWLIEVLNVARPSLERLGAQ